MNIDRAVMPSRIQKLPTDERGFPIPRFVKWVAGRPDFRQVSEGHWARCARLRMCWICGEPMGANLAFVCGPSTYLTGATTEPPSHLECAQYAIQVCPFIAFPQRPRDEVPEGYVPPKGIVAVDRNPGVWALWVCRSFELRPAGDTVAILPGPAVSCQWFARRAPAHFDEVAAALEVAFDRAMRALPFDRDRERRLLRRIVDFKLSAPR